MLIDSSNFCFINNLCYNRNITINGTYIFFKNIYDNGIRFINDLMTENGKFYNLEELKNKTGISLNVLHFQGMINSIKTYLSKTNTTLVKKVECPFIPSHIRIFLQQKTGAQAMYNILNKNDEQPTGKKTWNEKLHLTDDEWKKIYSFPFDIIKYPAIQWFQISINHNILVTNYLLVKMKIKQDSKCYYCQSHEETITHLFWTCNKIQVFLNDLLRWLKNYDIYCEINVELFMFGLDRKNNISKPLSIILMYAKYYIYFTRCNQRILNLDVFKKKFLILYKTLKEISLHNNKLTEFDEEWTLYNPLLNSIINL